MDGSRVSLVQGPGRQHLLARSRPDLRPAVYVTVSAHTASPVSFDDPLRNENDLGRGDHKIEPPTSRLRFLGDAAGTAGRGGLAFVRLMPELDCGRVGAGCEDRRQSNRCRRLRKWGCCSSRASQ